MNTQKGRSGIRRRLSSLRHRQVTMSESRLVSRTAICSWVIYALLPSPFPLSFFPSILSDFPRTRLRLFFDPLPLLSIPLGPYRVFDVICALFFFRPEPPCVLVLLIPNGPVVTFVLPSSSVSFYLPTSPYRPVLCKGIPGSSTTEDNHRQGRGPRTFGLRYSPRFLYYRFFLIRVLFVRPLSINESFVEPRIRGSYLLGRNRRRNETSVICSARPPSLSPSCILDDTDSVLEWYDP